MPCTDLIDSYCSYLRSESRSFRTIRERRRTLLALDRELPQGLDGSCEDELRDWLWHDNGWTISTRETYFGAFASFYKWGARYSHFDFDPAAFITRPKVPDRLPNPVTDAELAEALRRSKEPIQLWVRLAAYAGLRCLDISQMVRECITEQSVTVLASKGGKARVIPTHPVIWEAVRGLPSGPITDLDEGQVSRCANRYFNHTLKLRGVRMHRFRHWFGTMVQRLYKDLRLTQELMGHTDPRTTAGYALVAADSSRAAVDMLPRFDAGLLAGASQEPAASLGP